MTELVVGGVRLLASWFELAGSESRSTGWQSSGAGNPPQAAIRLDTEAADGSIPGVAYVKEAAVVAQGQVGRGASSAR